MTKAAARARAKAIRIRNPALVDICKFGPNSTIDYSVHKYTKEVSGEEQRALRHVPLLDLRAQFSQIRDEVMPEISRICESQALILGEAVRKFEEAVAPYCGVPHAIGCA